MGELTEDQKARRRLSYKKWKDSHPEYESSPSRVESKKKAYKKWYSKNKEKILRKKREEYHINPRRLGNAADSVRRRHYGISPEEYATMLESQGGKCKICGGVNASGRGLCVDHNHETGVVRGLLCGRCNSGIGLLGDNVTILESAIKYILGENHG